MHIMYSLYTYLIKAYYIVVLHDLLVNKLIRNVLNHACKLNNLPTYKDNFRDTIQNPESISHIKQMEHFYVLLLLIFHAMFIEIK